MALDRFIYWTEEKPTPQQIQFVVEDFFAGLAKTIEWSKDRWIITLPGNPSDPLQRVDAIRAIYAGVRYSDERWIEVWLDPDGSCIDIMTRQTDTITNSIANGLEKVILNYWSANGEVTSK